MKLIILSVAIAAILFFAIQPNIEKKADTFGRYHMADRIADTLEDYNAASPLEICGSNTGENRRLRLHNNTGGVLEIIELAPIQVRERVFICADYLLLRDGTDSVNVLGHYFDNTIYRIADGKRMASFSSEALPANNCEIFVF